MIPIGDHHPIFEIVAPELARLASRPPRAVGGPAIAFKFQEF